MTDISQDEKLNDLLTRVRTLPREIDPPAGAWAAIQSEIERPGVISEPRLQRALSLWQRPAFLVAAGLALVAASSLVTIEVMKERVSVKTSTVSVSSKPTSEPTSERGPANFTEFVSIEHDYISSANQLSDLLESERTTLSPETVAKLKQSLAIIDGAIIEARRALAEDPANRAIVDMLNTSYNQKIDLLRRTTEMART